MAFHGQYSAFFPAVASLFSFVASLLLLVWLWRLRESTARRLMARQLWHLAVADLLSSAMLIPWYVFALLQASGNEHNGALICPFGHANNIPFMTSVFLEVHIALATIATIFHNSRALRALSRSLPFIWALGFIVGGAVVALGEIFLPEDDGVLCDKYDMEGEKLKAVIMAVALVVCIATYAIGMGSVGNRHGGGVAARVWRHANLFIVAALVTWVPFVIFSLWWTFSDNTNGVSTWYYLTRVFLESNGSFNALVYVWRSGFLRRTRSRTMRRPIFHNGEESPTGRASGSFHPAFTSFDEVLAVPSETGAANDAAEAEAAALHDGDGDPPKPALHDESTQVNAPPVFAPNFRAQSGSGEDFLSCFVVSEQSSDSGFHFQASPPRGPSSNRGVSLQEVSTSD